MKVSILVHNRDRADVLDSCLASVASQQYRPLQVVIHDANSTDRSHEVIERWVDHMAAAGIDAGWSLCDWKGVAASRNDLALHADGDLLFYFDNDATLASGDTIALAVDRFRLDDRLGLLSAQVILRDSAERDPMAWVFRRDPEQWWSRQFETFTFAGTGFCVRADAFQSQGGFWAVLPYAREEEDLGLGLLGAGWTMRYEPAVGVRHHPSDRGRLDLAERRRVELRNGMMVLWRRLPLPLAVAAIMGRLVTSTRRARNDSQPLLRLLSAVPDAVRCWRRGGCRRTPVKWTVAYRYLALHRVRGEHS